MRRGAGGVALHADDEPAVRGAVDLGGVGRVRQVERHQRLERRARGQRGADAVAVAAAEATVVTGGLRFGITTARAKARAVAGDDGGKLRAVPQVQVPVVRPS